MQKSPRYFDDPMASFRRFALAAGMLTLAVCVYAVGTFAGVLQP